MDNSSNSSVNPVVPDFSRTKKENKFLKIFIPILIVLLVAAGVVATLFITGVIGGKDNGPEDTVDTDIKDEEMISKINDKLGILFGASVENSEIIVNSSNYDDVLLWQTLDYNEEQRINRILNSLDQSESIELDSVQLEAAASVWVANGGASEQISADNIIAFNGETVAAKYTSTFIITPDRTAMTSQRVQYVSDHDFYFKLKNTETPTSFYRHYYISRYFRNGNQAYVYISGGLYDESARTAYCDVFTPDYTGIKEVCTTVAEGNSFAINSENSGSYLQRMLSFYLAKNGEIYYIGSESPIVLHGYNPDAEE